MIKACASVASISPLDIFSSGADSFAEASQLKGFQLDGFCYSMDGGRSSKDMAVMAPHPTNHGRWTSPLRNLFICHRSTRIGFDPRPARKKATRLPHVDSNRNYDPCCQIHLLASHNFPSTLGEFTSTSQVNDRLSWVLRTGRTGRWNRPTPPDLGLIPLPGAQRITTITVMLINNIV